MRSEPTHGSRRWRRRPAQIGARWVVAIGFAAYAFAASSAAGDDEFTQWIAALEAEAIERGISAETARSALASARVVEDVLRSDRSQPQAPEEFCDYLRKRLTTTRIARGRRMLAQHRELLAAITADYGVPGRYLVALWGLETNFGDYQGEIPMFDALVTLAQDPRRGDFFRSQIFGALRIVDEGHHPLAGFVGSWAGATGQVQFMPKTFLAFAVDRDGDGRRDLWSSLPDALASAANYLRQSGWRPGETWGRQVRLARSIPTRGEKTLREWQNLGVRRIGGGNLPNANVRATMVLPTRSGDPVFLAYHNYEVFLAWNRSTFFAISVGTLADELVGKAAFVGCGR
jgi:membrane-bound lytic murein transglycosylase B